jgi:diadenosine tetraphosphatase ApaH/serine/threonine PP2A family protein phosphatase
MHAKKRLFVLLMQTFGDADIDTAWLPSLVSADDVLELCEAARDVLASQATLVEVGAPAKVFGDLHGQFHDLLLFFRKFGCPSHRHGGDIDLCEYVFIGDFVDRGAYSCEVMVLLLALKVRYPKRIWLLRGNHEDREVNGIYGFLQFCGSLFAPRGDVVHAAFNDVFDWLPLAGLVNGSVLCVHGGLGSNVRSLDQIRGIRRPLRTPMLEPLALDLLWSDPTRDEHDVGVHANPNRGAKDVVMFGPDVVRSFCAANGVDLIIRAHEVVDQGYLFFAGGHLATVFSARNYAGQHHNHGAFFIIRNDGLIIPKVLQARAEPQRALARLWPSALQRDISPVRRSSDYQRSWRDAA